MTRIATLVRSPLSCAPIYYVPFQTGSFLLALFGLQNASCIPLQSARARKGGREQTLARNRITVSGHNPLQLWPHPAAGNVLHYRSRSPASVPTSGNQLLRYAQLSPRSLDHRSPERFSRQVQRSPAFLVRRHARSEGQRCSALTCQRRRQGSRSSELRSPPYTRSQHAAEPSADAGVA